MPNNRTKVTNDDIRSFINNNPSTIKEVAVQFKVTAATARKHLVEMNRVGAIFKEGVKLTPSGSRGRSPDLYVFKQSSDLTAALQSLPDLAAVQSGATPISITVPQ